MSSLADQAYDAIPAFPLPSFLTPSPSSLSAPLDTRKAAQAHLEVVLRERRHELMAVEAEVGRVLGEEREVRGALGAVQEEMDKGRALLFAAREESKEQKTNANMKSQYEQQRRARIALQALTTAGRDKLKELTEHKRVLGEKRERLEGVHARLQREVKAKARAVEEDGEKGDGNNNDSSVSMPRALYALPAPTAFYQRLSSMCKGADVVWMVGGVATPARACVRNNNRSLVLLPPNGNKPLLDLPLSMVTGVVYPSPQSAKKKKKGQSNASPALLPFMQFAVHTSQGGHVMGVTSIDALCVWVLGLRALTATPGQREMSKGEFLWSHVSYRVGSMASSEGISPSAFVARAFLSLRPVAPEAEAAEEGGEE